MRVGIDLDNTLVNYTNVFKLLASKSGITADYLTKKQLRDILLKMPNGNHRWQVMQGKAYGKYMNYATVYQGAPNFFLRLKRAGIKPVIVSHKTQYGHFDEEKFPLRDVAMKWLKQNNFFGKYGLGLEISNVHFTDTREDKAQLISSLDFDYFIDDLIEVFEEPAFPNDVKKILFGSCINNKEELSFNSQSWFEVSNYVFGELNKDEIKDIIQYALVNQSEIIEIYELSGGGNSKVFKVITTNGTIGVKFFKDKVLDGRNRLGNEAIACELFRKFSLSNCLNLLEANDSMNIGIYSWIYGDKVQEISDNDIYSAISFVKKLHLISREVKVLSIPNASEDCIVINNLIDQIEQRRSRLITEAPYLKLSFFETFDSILSQAISSINDKDSVRSLNIKKRLDPIFLTLSPSDFGFHNAIRNESGELIWIDFEYFGWDDPVKLIADFLWHPGMWLSENQKKIWVRECLNYFSNDVDLKSRLQYCWPLIGLKWSLILLNEFIPWSWEQRVSANKFRDNEKPFILRKQLEKAKIICMQLKDDNFECRYL
jgi:thiamine kinase-like enzyme